MPADDLTAALRACAAGLYPLEAGTELLISNSTFLRRGDFTTRFISCGASGSTPMAAIDWDAAVTALASGGLPCSGGERRILHLSASLAAGQPASPQASPSTFATPSPASTTTTPPGCSPPSATQPETDPRTADTNSRVQSREDRGTDRSRGRLPTRV